MIGRESASDRVVIQKVTQVLINHGLRPPCEIHVICRGGNVTLTGTIQFEYQRKNAVRSASTVPGVRRVKDEMAVKHRVTWGDRSTWRPPPAN